MQTCAGVRGTVAQPAAPSRYSWIIHGCDVHAYCSGPPRAARASESAIACSRQARTSKDANTTNESRVSDRTCVGIMSVEIEVANVLGKVRKSDIKMHGINQMYRCLQMCCGIRFHERVCHAWRQHLQCPRMPGLAATVPYLQTATSSMSGR
jgi:hypothetical protein